MPLVVTKLEDSTLKAEPASIELFDTDEESDKDEHGQSHQHRATRPQFQCPLCSKRFTRNQNLQGHLRTHSQQKPYPCSHCSKTFTRAHDRKVHETEVHTTGHAHRHVCKDFVYKDKEGDSIRQCKGCGKSFTRLTTLKRHQESITHEVVQDVQEIEGELQQLGEGLPLEAFSTWLRTGKMNDLSELTRSISEAKHRQQNSQPNLNADDDG